MKHFFQTTSEEKMKAKRKKKLNEYETISTCNQIFGKFSDKITFNFRINSKNKNVLLKINPKDEDTRYNLAFAQRQLKKQQDQQKKNDKNKDKNKDQKDKEDKKDKGGEKDKKDQKDKDGKDKQEQPQMSKEQAEQMLNALKNREKKMQASRVKKGEPGQRKKIEKDW